MIKVWWALRKKDIRKIDIPIAMKDYNLHFLEHRDHQIDSGIIVNFFTEIENKWSRLANCHTGFCGLHWLQAWTPDYRFRTKGFLIPSKRLSSSKVLTLTFLSPSSIIGNTVCFENFWNGNFHWKHRPFVDVLYCSHLLAKKIRKHQTFQFSVYVSISGLSKWKCIPQECVTDYFRF